ncbi:hypothetical protein BDQ17DRAFT_1228700, partial [Cyathus striatus]
MFSCSILIALALVGSANAHFHLNYPEPRGIFVADQEPLYCGGYTNAVSNRTTFPLNEGFFTITSSHGGFTAGVAISTVQNSVSFDNFTESEGEFQFVHPYSKEENAGTFCIPLNVSAANISGVTDGANVTIQIIFDGGDGLLYQCADLTLSSNFIVSNDVKSTCKNVTSQVHDHSSSTTPASASSTADAQNTSGALGKTQQLFGYTATFLGLGGAI